MTGILEFIGNPTVQSTALLTMAITALLAALPKPGTINIKNIKDFLAISYKFVYDWSTGFWSMKTGQKPAEVHVQTSEQTATTSKTQDATFIADSNPTPPVTPAQPTK
jgi:Co/Zn/Cd efflux system component